MATSRVQEDSGYRRGYLCSKRWISELPAWACVCLCVLFGFQRLRGASALQLALALARAGERGRQPEAQISSQPLPSHPIPQTSTITSEVLPLHCPPPPPNNPGSLLIGWEEEGEGGGGVSCSSLGLAALPGAI